jgi:hypothetical protein
MNQHDARDRNLHDYVRTRMAADAPPEFTRSVMDTIDRTPQRRRSGWPMLASVATVAAAVVAVVIGLSLLGGGPDVGLDPSASASASPSASESASASPSASPSASTSASASEEPSAEPTSQEGEFGPIQSMEPEEAFANGQSCETSGMISNGQPTDLGYTIAFPENWFTNEASEHRGSCTLFGPEPIEVGEGGMAPESVVVEANLPAGGDFGPGGTVTSREEFTVDGVAALRYEIDAEPGGFVSEPMVVWVVAIDGGLPSEGNDRPYLVLSVASADEAELAERADVLDRMVATLDVPGGR